jgi:hypothetical protein
LIALPFLCLDARQVHIRRLKSSLTVRVRFIALGSLLFTVMGGQISTV